MPLAALASHSEHTARYMASGGQARRLRQQPLALAWGGKQVENTTARKNAGMTAPHYDDRLQSTVKFMAERAGSQKKELDTYEEALEDKQPPEEGEHRLCSTV